MMLAHAEDVQTDLIGQLDLLEQIAQPLGGAHGQTGSRVWGRFSKGVDADLHWRFEGGACAVPDSYHAQQFTCTFGPAPGLS